MKNQYKNTSGEKYYFVQFYKMQELISNSLTPGKKYLVYLLSFVLREAIIYWNPSRQWNSRFYLYRFRRTVFNILHFACSWISTIHNKFSLWTWKQTFLFFYLFLAGIFSAIEIRQKFIFFFIFFMSAIIVLFIAKRRFYAVPPNRHIFTNTLICVLMITSIWIHTHTLIYKYIVS